MTSTKSCKINMWSEWDNQMKTQTQNSTNVIVMYLIYFLLLCCSYYLLWVSLCVLHNVLQHLNLYRYVWGDRADFNTLAHHCQPLKKQRGCVFKAPESLYLLKTFILTREFCFASRPICASTPDRQQETKYWLKCFKMFSCHFETHFV